MVHSTRVLTVPVLLPRRCLVALRSFFADLREPVEAEVVDMHQWVAAAIWVVVAMAPWEAVADMVVVVAPLK